MKHIICFVLSLFLSFGICSAQTTDQQEHWGPAVALYLPVSYENFEFHMMHQEAMVTYIYVSLTNKYIKQDKEIKESVAKAIVLQDQIKIMKNTYKLKQKSIRELKKNGVMNDEVIKAEQETLLKSLNNIYIELHNVYQDNKHVLDL